MANMEKLIRKRASLKRSLTNFIKLMDDLELQHPQSIPVNHTNRRLLEQWIKSLQESYQKFVEVQDEIEATAEDFEEQLIQRDEFHDKYIRSIVRAEAKLINNDINLASYAEDHTQSIGSSQSRNFTMKPNSDLSNIRLPTISLPEFSGNIENWLEFRDIFSSLIHTSNSLSAIQKFHYLRASLKNEAALIINSLEFSATNYEVDWQTLCNRYNNNQRLVQNHVKAIFDLPHASKESAKSLRKLVDSLNKHLRALETLGQPVNTWDPLLIHIISNKLDFNSSREWETYRHSLDEINFDMLKSFLENRANVFESLEEQAKPMSRDKKDLRTLLVSNHSCPICKESHMLYSCPQFQKLSVLNRFEKAKELKYCINCLKSSGHSSKTCKGGSCRQCNARHHTLLHRQPPNSVENNNQASTSTGVVLTNTMQQSQSEVLLGTAVVHVRDRNNALQVVRVLLDTGAQSSFITARCRKRLNLITSKVHINMIGLNEVSSTIQAQCRVEISSRINNFQFETNVFVVQNISSFHPRHKINTSSLNIPSHLILADPHFYQPAEIDMLIGADHFWSLLGREQIKLGSSLPVLQETKLGWILSGPISRDISNTIHCHFTRFDELNTQLQKFWELEECDFSKTLSPEESACEAHFVDNFERDLDGRFIVALPLKVSAEKLGNSEILARKRFLQLEKRLNKDEKMHHLYSNFMNEYISLGHMTSVEISQDKVTYFMPHHGVFKEDSLSTKLRVVFNASAQTTSGLSLTSSTNDYLLTSYSDLNKFQRIMVYCLRFRGNHTGQEISLRELQNALTVLARLSQKESSGNNITVIKKQFASLNPFLDDNHIIRVGGRLAHSSYAYTKKYSILLSSKHPLSALIMNCEHIRLLHVGPQQLLAHLPEQFWIIGGRSLSRKIVRNCLKCFKTNPRKIQPQMVNLPQERLTPAPPFSQTGIDYAGPFLKRNSKGGGAKLVKCYICLFVCLTVKAVHLELVTDLTTDRFILPLRRFIARREKPSCIHSDNSRNFVGAKAELKKIKQFFKNNADEIRNTLTEHGIEWKFIPPHAPHFGGLWERAIRACKTHLYRVIGNAKLTFEETYTLLVQIKAVMNYLPLTPISADPNDLNPLTPGHFLVGRPLASFPERNIEDIPNNRLNVYQHVQQLYQHFWRRWRKEYISELQQRRKWTRSDDKSLSVEDMVLLIDDNLPPLKWLIGRVTKVIIII